jgi:glycosyltransferase involved in cell wall biosynthesis
MPKLLVLIPDRISDILVKGEYQPRYYNPGQVFDEVHILSTTIDDPDREALQRTVGNAKLHLHYHSDDPTLIGSWPGIFRRRVLDRWAQGGVEIARSIGADLIRCHSADWNSFLASRIKRALGTPYVVSLHINPDVNALRRILKSDLSRSEAKHNAFFEYLEREGLVHADLVMPVYEPILPYLARCGVSRAQVCYNVLNGEHLRKKSNYQLGSPPRIICVGRLLDEKDPTAIIQAVASIPRLELLIVGDGPKRPELVGLVGQLGVADRVKFSLAIENDRLCEMLPEFDLFVVHTEYWELNKSVIEALLTGLPLIINRRHGEPVPELENVDFVRMVDNSTASYRDALIDLLNDHAKREALGRAAYAHAEANWAPAKTEAVYAGIYRRLLGAAGPTARPEVQSALAMQSQRMIGRKTT